MTAVNTVIILSKLKRQAIGPIFSAGGVLALFIGAMLIAVGAFQLLKRDKQRTILFTLNNATLIPAGLKGAKNDTELSDDYSPTKISSFSTQHTGFDAEAKMSRARVDMYTSEGDSLTVGFDISEQDATKLKVQLDKALHEILPFILDGAS